MPWFGSKEKSASSTRPTEEIPAPVTASRTSRGRRSSISSTTSSLRCSRSSSREPPAAAAAAATALTPGGGKEETGEIQDVDETVYEINAKPKRKSWVRRHWFVIAITVIGLGILGVIVGVVIVKTGIKGGQRDGYFGQGVVPGQTIGGTRTFDWDSLLPGKRDFLVGFSATSTSTSTPTPAPAPALV